MSAVPLDAEAWRYSARAWQALHVQEFVAASPVAELPPSLAAAFDWPQTRTNRIVFVNGEAQADAEIRLRDGERLHLVFVNMPAARATRWQREFTIALDAGSAEIVEQHIGEAGADVLGELGTQLRLGAGAQLRVISMSDLPDSVSLRRSERIDVAAGGAYTSHQVVCGGRLQRFDLDVTMAGARASYLARGVFMPRARQHIDVHLDAKHVAGDTRSDVAWRGVADGRGRGILHGAITVAQGADGADARLETKNLLLSPHAEIDAQPVLEIYADEVKAAHGATVGQLDERALFYLRSRGIPVATARALMIGGFCREAFDGIADGDLRAHMDALLDAHLAQVVA
jgi:Fe-S cluster assembly protein SufD